MLSHVRSGFFDSEPLQWPRIRIGAAAIAYVVLASWQFYPFLRRLVDWKLGYGHGLVLDLLPFVVTALLAIPLLRGGWRNVDRPMWILAWLWVGAFGAALGIGLVSFNGLPAIVSFTQFVLPLVFGLWLSSVRTSEPGIFDRIIEFMLWCCAIQSVYGLIQYVSPQPWDVAWLKNVQFTSVGRPVPFGLRIFGMSNGPATLATLIVMSLLLTFGKLRLSVFGIVRIAVSLVALALTQVRADWVALAVGVTLYMIVSHRRAVVLGTLSGAVALVVATAVMLPAAVGNQNILPAIVARFSTLGDLRNDMSAQDRRQETEQGLVTAIGVPTGVGLGTIGTAVQAGGVGQAQAFDNGYVARFLELGYFGIAAYLATVLASFFMLFRSFRPEDRGIAAACLAVQGAFLWIDVSSDNHLGLPGMLYWMVTAIGVALVCRARSMTQRTPV